MKFKYKLDSQVIFIYQELEFQGKIFARHITECINKDYSRKYYTVLSEEFVGKLEVDEHNIRENSLGSKINEGNWIGELDYNKLTKKEKETIKTMKTMVVGDLFK